MSSQREREAVEKAMREAVKSWPRDRGEAAMNIEAFHASVACALALIQKERERSARMLRIRNGVFKAQAQCDLLVADILRGGEESD